jgi:hypothetical protein
LNLSAKALLSGPDIEAFEAEIQHTKSLSAAEHRLYQKAGPVGKAHHLVVDIFRSDRLYYLLLEIQKTSFEASGHFSQRAYCVVLDNDTRWLSQLHMIRRLLKLRPYIPRLVYEFEKEWMNAHRSKRTGIVSANTLARKLRILCQENQLTDHDWDVLELTAEIFLFYKYTVKILEGDGIRRKRSRG